MSSKIIRKSRTGCLRCKVKKIKCDERRPDCSRCEDRGERCPGYALNIGWSSKHQLQPHATWPARLDTGPATSNTLIGIVKEDFLDPQVADEQINANILDDPLSLSQCNPPPSAISFTAQTITDGAGPPGLQPSSLNTEPIQLGWAYNFLPADELLPDDSTCKSSAFLGGHCSLLDQTSSSANQQVTYTCSDLDFLLDEDVQLFASTNLFHTPSALSNYFFKEVIPLYCTWDSDVNPFRVMLSKMWQSSSELYHTLQSMAAMALTRDLPHMGTVAKNERVEAIQCLQKRPYSSLVSADQALAAFLLGHSSSWIDPADTATHLFDESCQLIEFLSDGDIAAVDRLFLEEAIDYWEMLIVFFGNANRQNNHRSVRAGAYPGRTQHDKPHSWNGISRETVAMLTDVGRLVVQVKELNSYPRLVEKERLNTLLDAIQKATSIEERLSTAQRADTSLFRDTGDLNSPPAHFALIDDAFRQMGLLQLYRVFPDLLLKRFYQRGPETVQGSEPQTLARHEMDAWLTNLALSILQTLQRIPFESGTRCIQPLILIAVSSELRLDPEDLTLSIDVARARNFVRSRLSSLLQMLPLRKSMQHYELVNKVWEVLDAGNKDIYWMDVAAQTQLSTLLG